MGTSLLFMSVSLRKVAEPIGDINDEHRTQDERSILDCHSGLKVQHFENLTDGGAKSSLSLCVPYCKTKTGQWTLEDRHCGLDVKTTLLHSQQHNTETLRRHSALFLLCQACYRGYFCIEKKKGRWPGRIDSLFIPLLNNIY